ncbi:hypothetical protein HK102_009400 [Quaeritorhiza haematococci]|nr:hypothetical protein HK102_009400 [Quaeritorhiza haematococci]
MPALKRKHPEHLIGGADIVRTTVVCTVGPASHSKEIIASLVEGGMHIIRINMAHSSHDFALKVIKDVREYLKETNHTAQVAIWLDINGPKVRTGRLQDGKPVFVQAGDDFFFVNDENLIGDSTRIATTYTKELVNIGDKMYVDDGLLSFTVVERLENSIRTTVDNSGYLGPNKGINFPSHVIEDLPAVSEKDKADISFAIEQGVDFISVSCIRNIDDVEEVRLLLGNSKIKLLAKIENGRGMENFNSILKMADGIVIDRGYLGAEVDVETVATAQKKMIALANMAGKPVLVANQVLESMRSHPRPSRSEAADIANAVLDGVDGLVLSAETAVGQYVLEALATLRRIALQAERNTNYLEYQLKQMRSIPKPIAVSESIASSAVSCARQVNASIIICPTELGGTARLVAKYRPTIPVVAATLIEQTSRQLSMSFGVVSYYHNGSPDDIVHETMRFAVEVGLCSPGQIAVITSGQVIGFLEGTTTKMQVLKIPEFN